MRVQTRPVAHGATMTPCLRFGITMLRHGSSSPDSAASPQSQPADLLERWSRAVTIAVLATFVLGTALSVAHGAPQRLPGVALDWPLLLHLERGIVAATGAALLALFVLRGLEGNFPSKLSTTGAEWSGTSSSLVAEISAKLVAVERRSKEVVDELRHLLPADVSSPSLDRLDRRLQDWSAALGEADDAARLAQAISRLPEREKLVFTLHAYEDLSVEEIAEMLGTTQSRVDRLYRAALRELENVRADDVHDR